MRTIYTLQSQLIDDCYLSSFDEIPLTTCHLSEAKFYSSKRIANDFCEDINEEYKGYNFKVIELNVKEDN